MFVYVVSDTVNLFCSSNVNDIGAYLYNAVIKNGVISLYLGATCTHTDRNSRLPLPSFIIILCTAIIVKKKRNECEASLLLCMMWCTLYVF